jgi:hypothetical protein
MHTEFCVRKPAGQRPVERSMHICRNDIKMDIKEDDRESGAEFI